VAVKESAAKKAATPLSMAEVTEQVNKRFGAGTLIRASEAKNVHPRLSSGSLSFDAMLGGGLVANQFNETVGEYSSGKSAFYLQCIAFNQRIDPEFQFLWVAAEEWVGDWAEANGVDSERGLIAETNVMEEVYEIVLAATKSRGVDLIVIDSLPALVPVSEDEKSIEEFTVGLAARINNKFFRKGHNSTRRSLVEEERPCTVGIINQWREDIGISMGDNRVTPGGKGKDFAYFTKTELRRVEWIDVGVKGDGKQRVGMTVRGRTHKNKIAPAQRTAEVDFYFDTIGGHQIGWDRAKDTLTAGIYYGVIEGGGTAWLSFGGNKWNGREKMIPALREDVDLQNGIRREVLRIANPAQAAAEAAVNGKKVKGAAKKIAIKRG
jgi:recombination protein RecA